MTYSMSTAAARKASKKTQHVRSAGDWITLILLVAGALLVLFPLLVLTVNAFKTSADYNATGPLSLPKHFTMEGIISFWTTTNFPLKFWNSFIISAVPAGSRPAAGSSRSKKSGFPTRDWATARR